MDYPIFINQLDNTMKKDIYKEAWSETIDPLYIIIVLSNVFTAYLLDDGGNSKNKNKYWFLGLNGFVNVYMYHLVALKYNDNSI
jgi:hypothetical protein